jgi:uncharacterized membrane protein (DUF2068 family)
MGVKKEISIELWIVIILAILNGIADVVLSRHYLTHPDNIIMSNYSILVYLVLIIGIIEIIAAGGLYKGMLWAWYLAVIGSFIFLIINVIFSALYVIDIYSIGINVVVLYLLYRPRVRNYFKKSV